MIEPAEMKRIDPETIEWARKTGRYKYTG